MGAAVQVSTSVEWRDKAAVLSVSGDVDMVTAPQVEQELSALLEQQPEVLVVDLAEVGFFASAGLTALVAAYKQAEGRTGLRVVATSSATVRPLKVTALDRKIPVFDSVEAALA
ncbi:STAS domain-containing protein [Saccharopolyspora erythraea]|nr:STAS domain-containing protein [Saccharopolyspora erythraea]